MNLLIDIGNTRTKWLLQDGGVAHARGAVANQSLATLDFSEFQVETAIASCVANQRVFDLIEVQVEAELGVDLQRALVTERAGGLTNAYRRRDQLGVDRWLAAIGAYHLAPGRTLIVVDAGTALTVDLVTSDNVFQGGVILPGVSLMQESLIGNTAGIASEPADVVSVVGQTTQECVNAGAQYGAAGAIERIVKELAVWRRSDGAHDPVVMLCGGDAERLSALLAIEHRVEADLVFGGLSVVLS